MEKLMKRWYTITYVDNARGDSVRTWEGYAEDSADAFDYAFDDDYYYGTTLSIDYYEIEDTD
jgi:hypothetical protein